MKFCISRSSFVQMHWVARHVMFCLCGTRVPCKIKIAPHWRLWANLILQLKSWESMKVNESELNWWSLSSIRRLISSLVCRSLLRACNFGWNAPNAKRIKKRHKNRYDKQCKYVHTRWRSQTQPQHSTECHSMPLPHQQQPACLSAGNTSPPPLSPPPRTKPQLADAMRHGKCQVQTEDSSQVFEWVDASFRLEDLEVPHHS